MRYFIQYAAGTGDLLLEALPNYLRRIQVHYRDDSAMIVETSSEVGRVASVPFVKNSFSVIATTPRRGLDEGVHQFSRILRDRRFPPLPSSSRAFRTMVHVDGKLQSVDQRARSALERTIAARTGGRVEPRGMCQEFWVIGRVDLNEFLFCARLPKTKRPPKARGAISYELSSMLVSASRPDPQDVFLDPFAGSGSFILARLDMPARRVWYSDISREFRKELPREVTGDRRVTLLSEDALVLQSIPDGEVDVIVTDPPWGEFEDVGMPYQKFAHGIAESFDRVLNRRHGRFVVLSARRTAETLTRSFEDVGLFVTTTHEILVNGHPATVIIGGRRRT